MWASEITELLNYLQQSGTFLWGSGHDAKDEEPNLDLFLLQLMRPRPGLREHMAFRDDGQP